MAAANITLPVLEGVKVVQRPSTSLEPRFAEIGIGTTLRISDQAGEFTFHDANLTSVGTINGRDVASAGQSLDDHLLVDALEKHQAKQIFIEDSGDLYAAGDTEAALAEVMGVATAANDNADTRLKLDGTTTPTADITLGGFRIVSLATPSAGTDAVNRDYVTNLVASSGSASEWQDSVKDKDLTAPPGSPVLGDRYLIGLDPTAGLATGAWAGEDGKIAEWDGSAWTFRTNSIGTYVSVDDETDGFYFFGSPVWTKKFYENTTASGFLSKVGNDIQLTALPSAQLIVGNGSGVATARTITGDVAFSNLGVATIQANAITNPKIANGAVDEFKIPSSGLTEGLKGGSGAKLGVDYAKSFLNSTGSTIPALSVVAVQSDGSIALAQATQANIQTFSLAITEASIANAAAGLSVVKHGAPITFGSPVFTPGLEVYLSRSSAGGVTQSLSGFLANEPVIIVGKAITTQIMIWQPQFLRMTSPMAQYNFTADGVATQFTLGQTLSSTQVVMVYMDGRLQFESVAFTRNLSPGRIDFASVPNNGSRISVIVVNI
jgi:hypothetical protein